MIAAILFDARGSTYLDIGSNFASCHRQINPAFSSFIRARIIRVAIEWERSGRVNNFCRCRRARVCTHVRARAPAPCAHRSGFNSGKLFSEKKGSGPTAYYCSSGGIRSRFSPDAEDKTSPEFYRH